MCFVFSQLSWAPYEQFFWHSLTLQKSALPLAFKKRSNFCCFIKQLSVFDFFPFSEPEMFCLSKTKTFRLHWSFYLLSTSPYLKSYFSVTENCFLRQGCIIRPQAFGSSLARSNLFQTDVFSSRVFNISVFSNIFFSGKGNFQSYPQHTLFLLNSDFALALQCSFDQSRDML